ncbi:GNAT family N-acetyltransferase [Desulfobacterales bacterium HSG2]|nr:GNAT family N-acetyltransferase [Desulfobacterales bacterium HSG2]
MDVKIDNIRPVSNEEWDNIWKRSSYVSYGSSRDFAEKWSGYTDGKVCPAAHMVVFSDGKTALLPFSIRKHDKKYILSPAMSNAGWMSTDNIAKEHEALLADYLTRKIENIFWVVNPFQKISVLDKIIAKAVTCETRVLNLTDGFELIYKMWKKGSVDRKIRKALKSGVEVRIASCGEEWTEFCEVVYQDSIKRWGDNAGMVFEIEKMKDFKTPHIRLWLALYQHKIIAGSVISYGNNVVEYWAGAALQEYFPLRPVNLLFCECIKDSCERGYAWFDFGPSLGMDGTGGEGVLAFKKSFGATELPLYIST